MNSERHQTAPRARRLSIRDIAGFVVSVVAVGAVVWWASRQEAPAFPTSPGDLTLVGAGLLVYVVATLARGWRWHLVLRCTGIEHPPVDAYALVTVGYMGNTVLPARGGEALRILLLAERSTARRREVLGSIIAERLFDVIALVLLFAALTIFGVAGTPAGTSPAMLASAALVGAAMGLFAYDRLRRAGRFERFANVLRPVARSSKIFATRNGPALLGVTIAVWFAEGLIFVLVGRALGLELSLPEGVFLVVFSSFFALIPAAPGYAGTYDAALLFGLHALDIRAGSAIGFAILARFVLFGPITVAGLVLLLTRYGGVQRAWRVLRERGDEAPEPA